VQKDYLGSYYSITDERGKIVLLHDREEQVFSFDPWGRRRHPQRWTYYTYPTTYLFVRGFTGHEHLDKFDFINMNGRIYDPVISYFTSPDPVIGIPNNAQGFNLYTYARNNPLRYVDPSGYLDTEVSDIGGGPSYSLYSPVIKLAEGGAFDAATSFYAGAFAGAFDAAIANGATLEAAVNLAIVAANNAFAASKFASHNPFNGAQKAYNNMVSAFKGFKSGDAFKSDGTKTVKEAKHGIDVGAKIISSSASFSSDGQIDFNFSKIAMQDAMAGTGVRMGQGKNANAASSGIAVKTLEEVEIKDKYKLAKETYYGGMALGASLYLMDGPSIGPGDAAGASYQAATIITSGILYTATFLYYAINPNYEHQKREDKRNAEKIRKQGLEHQRIINRNGMNNDIFGNGPNGEIPFGVATEAYIILRTLEVIYDYFDNIEVELPKNTECDSTELQLKSN